MRIGCGLPATMCSTTVGRRVVAILGVGSSAQRGPLRMCLLIHPAAAFIAVVGVTHWSRSTIYQRNRDQTHLERGGLTLPKWGVRLLSPLQGFEIMSPHLQTASCALMTEFGEFSLHGFKDSRGGLEHAALSLGAVTTGAPVLTRVHSECLTGDVFHSLHCDCGNQLRLALRTISDAGRGVLLYLRQEGRGIGLLNKIRAYDLQQSGADTVDANRLLGLPDDARDYAIAAEILEALGIRDVVLMTNNPAKVDGLLAHGVRVAQRMSLEAPRTLENGVYLDTKAARMGHLLSSVIGPVVTAAAEDDSPDATPPPSEGFCLSRRY